MIDFLTSWKDAERECFSRLIEYIGGQPDVSAFLGYLPEAAPDVWCFTSGDSEESQIERLQGDNPCFGLLRFKASANGQFTNREDAQKFACGVMQTLSLTGNMKHVGNVYFLRMTSMPTEPQLGLQESTGYYLWTVTVPMELVFSTSTNYNE
jgi:hypothetical protein